MAETPDLEESKKISDTIALVIAGHRTEDVLQAQSDCLVGIVSYSMPTVEESENLLDLLVTDMKKEIRKHHAYYRNYLSENAKKAGSA